VDLFESSLVEGVELLHGFALQDETTLLNDLKSIIAQTPLCYMVTPGGFTMSVAMTNCGKLGWISDRKGYRYDALDPSTGKPWQAMPTSLLD
jgi:alkylated DNA repair protein (DNA oxidative demethylase)